MQDHYSPRKISQISPKDFKVSLMGTVASISEGSFTLDDGSGKIEISSDIAVEKGGLVRAFCSMSGGKPRAEAVQSLKGFDLNLFKRVEKLYNKEGLNV